MLPIAALFTFITVANGSPSSPCRTSCGTITISYPFAIDDGCGSPAFRHMLNCSQTELFFLTSSGSYKVQQINYNKKNLVVYDPLMSTCAVLQARHDFLLSEIQSATIRPSSNTLFALLNCSFDSPIINRYSHLCFNFSDHSCEDLYQCPSFQVFRRFTNSSPPCCFTGFDTVSFMGLNIMDCSHYTTVIDTGKAIGIGPMDWQYGVELAYGAADNGCERCELSGGTCGFDTETMAMLCLCSPFANATRQCGPLMASSHTSWRGWRSMILSAVVVFIASCFPFKF